MKKSGIPIIGKYASRRESGDTLIEVTLALVILGMVLSSSLVVAVKSSQLGQTARERTRISNEAQAQIEALRGFRDNHTWDEFLNGDETGTYDGVLTGVGTSCHAAASTACLHMVPSSGSGSGYQIAADSMGGSVLGSYIEISVTPDPGPTTGFVDIIVSYGFDTAGGGGVINTGHIKTQLSNLQPVLPTPTPVASVSTPTPTPSPTPAGSGVALIQVVSAPGKPCLLVHPFPALNCYTHSYTNASLNPPGSVASCTWDWGYPGASDTFPGSDPVCNTGGKTKHTFPLIAPVPGKPVRYPVTLTIVMNNGAVAKFVYNTSIPKKTSGP